MLCREPKRNILDKRLFDEYDAITTWQWQFYMMPITNGNHNNHSNGNGTTHTNNAKTTKNGKSNNYNNSSSNPQNWNNFERSWSEIINHAYEQYCQDARNKTHATLQLQMNNGTHSIDFDALTISNILSKVARRIRRIPLLSQHKLHNSNTAHYPTANINDPTSSTPI